MRCRRAGSQRAWCKMPRICSSAIRSYARPAFKALEHPALGHFDHQTSPYHFSRTRAQISTAPMLGEHTEIACTEVLQIGRDAFEELKVAGVFY